MNSVLDLLEDYGPPDFGEGLEAPPREYSPDLDCLDQLQRPPTPVQEPVLPPQAPPPQGAPDNVPETRTSRIEDINISLKFISALQNASMESCELDPELLYRIRNPVTDILTVEEPDDRLSIDIFLAIGNASEATYTGVRAAILRRNPESKILTYYKVKRLVADLTGVVALEEDMC
ncbi:hypothetical protein DFH07DRAFT_960290 [Mycena maculata]|uniref:Uncharacterized protein n=1 Tax=Mycena maculata TaxID=230809 RepID=A0AAD7J024_9AGAR|nr:hypothetical protein DFH07DRAFT_960290 [Mycena maculata]